MNLELSGHPPEHGHDGERGDKHKWGHKRLFCFVVVVVVLFSITLD